MMSRVCRLHAAGDLRVEEAPVAEPGPGEVLVRVEAGGICGSDLHYYQHGGFGPVRIKEPIILGHEVAGTVEAVGEGVTTVRSGDRVALNPSRPCGRCRFCQEGRQQHCLDMWFYGSAMRFPHSQGAFRERIVAQAFQCEPIGDVVSFGEAACAEPLAVCLHAVRRAGELAGRRVLVTGAGPIGALTIAAARFAGAEEIVATDLHDAPLRTAAALGATRCLNLARTPDALEPFAADKGAFNIAFECSAAPAAMRGAFTVVRPMGRIVQVGVTGDLPIPLNVLVGKEIHLVGSFRFHTEYGLAARLIRDRRIDVRPLITSTHPIDDAVAAFELAGDRSRAMKVQISFH
jgi:L-idonate 5-dehydrogenase